MTNYSFADYENAILTALDGLRETEGGYLKTLRGYSGELDDRSLWEAVAARFPAVLVEVAGATYNQLNLPFPPLICQQLPVVNIIVAAHFWRDQADARTAANVGAYSILDAVRGLLMGKTFSLDIRHCLLLDENKLAHDLGAHVVLYLARYQLINDRITEENWT